MVAERHRAKWAIVMPLGALTLLLPVKRASAHGMAKMSMPNRDQVRNYKIGLEAWTVGLNEKDLGDRMPFLEKAERRFEKAAAGPGEFPEALLALFLVRYTENHI